MLKKILLKFMDWLVKCIDSGYRLEKPFVSEEEKRDWKEWEKKYFNQSRKLRNDVRRDK